ncbi:afadin- and alpha-actinin-binding protein-like [Corythoichthys intestinalis]|uniref:afadin- and alpha-actinin-binding protein-like n=1 Tax=Corythoichthys intestinalis TaxID=161448 RepID=UPI0025A5ECEE|nr:afadin- and alpha-actinin-binding protein-like [Corythoichthys intestinalis]XP_057696194.1 afadin- and alpha-actinin-binding protein-like [Corythoichthys intestinalis]XP_057696195.1 afadin- and alpha-actinin-binding protein-like [Corythoichthys intestinalis]XP_061791017.1 afadin- and alpha-actinin-binding protein-like [Nerophis lumbriciformis]
MPESSSDVKDVCSSSVLCPTPSKMGHMTQSPLPLHRNSYILTNFCTEHNLQECVTHINQELVSLCLSPVWTQSDGNLDVNVIPVLNCIYELLQLHRKGLQTLENMEKEQLKLGNNVDSLQLTSTRLKDQLEIAKRENTGLFERERQLQLKVKSLQNSLKNEKEEIHKLQNIISSRASQYNHEMKRKEREFNKLKEKLNQLLVDKKEKRLAIDIVNKLGRADGKRSVWKTEKTEAKHEGEMYTTLLKDHENTQRELLLENAELRKVLKQMKKDMVVILSSRKSTGKGETQDNGAIEIDSNEEEEVLDSCKESSELFSVHTREKLTNSVRRQWRRLKNHVEKLDNRASTDESEDAETIPRQTSKEMGKLKLEVRQCKDYILKQQSLLQRLSCQSEDTTSAVLGDSHISQEKDRLRDEWKNLEDQRKCFERERRNFTEAAIRLSQERKSFEEDRAMWLKHQFSNLSPFADSKKSQRSKSQCAFQILTEAKPSSTSLPEKPITSPTLGSTPSGSPSLSDRLHKFSVICENSSTKPNRSEDAGDASFLAEQHKCWISGDDHSTLKLGGDKNSSV